MNITVATILSSLILLGACAPSNEITLSEVSENIDDVGSDWELVWSDDFDNNELDDSQWKVIEGNGEWGWGNGERQNYQEDNLSFRDGSLVITAKKESIGDCHYGSCDYTSGKIETADLYTVKYGKIEARIKTPSGDGMWPAFWLIGANISSWSWPKCGEIDIMESMGRLPYKTSSALHSGENWESVVVMGKRETFPVDLTEDYHVYGIIWDTDLITFTVDNTAYNSISINSNSGTVLNPFGEDKRNEDQEFFIILNLAVGGKFDNYINPPSSFKSAELLVDWVRVSKRK
ncbi:MAG: glycoside hydrolase family 16 protein [Fibrobacterales bacterium]